MQRLIFIFSIIGIVLMPFGVFSEQPAYDVTISPGSVHFVPTTLYVGEQVRVYANIQNLGTRDITGYVGFYQGPSLLAPPHPFSLKANSVTEDVWIDWTPSEGRYNIMVKVDTVEPDQNPGNNVYLTPMMSLAKRPIPPPTQPSPVVETVPEQPKSVGTSSSNGSASATEKITRQAAKKIAEKLTPKLPVNPPAKTRAQNTQALQPVFESPSSAQTSKSKQGVIAPPIIPEAAVAGEKVLGTTPAPPAPQEVKGDRMFAPTVPRAPLDDPARKLLLVGIILAVGTLVAGGIFLRKSKT